MAHESKLSLTSKPAVAGVAIQEGRLVQIVASGLKQDLPTALLATSGVYLDIYVAFVPPDDFSRPTPASMYTAGSPSTFYENGAWGNFLETDTFYRTGLSTLENPVLASGYGLLAKSYGIYIVPSGCVVASADLQVVGTLVKVSDDNTGRWQTAANQANPQLGAIGRVVDYDPALQNYTFEMFK